MTVSVSGRYSVEDFRHRAWLAARNDDGREAGDFLFNEGLEEIIRDHARKEAAVLVAVTERDGVAQVLMTRRTEALRSHSGQIAFPGGRIDADDASPEAAALRECEEETGIGAAHLEVAARLSPYLSGSGYRIHPVLAVLHPGYEIRPNADEVDRVFDVPLSYLMDKENYRLGSRTWNGVERHFNEIPYKDRYIWGVTAGILRVIQERLYG